MFIDADLREGDWCGFFRNPHLVLIATSPLGPPVEEAGIPLCRRNLPAYQRTKLALRLESVISKRARENQVACLKQGGVIPVPQNSAKRAPIETRTEIANLSAGRAFPSAA